MKIELKQLQAAFGTTFVYITHDQSEALVLSDHVGVMNRGRFEQPGTPQELYYAPATPFVQASSAPTTGWAASCTALDGEYAEVETPRGWKIRGRRHGSLTVGAGVEAFIRPEATALGRSTAELPPARRYTRVR